MIASFTAAHFSVLRVRAIGVVAYRTSSTGDPAVVNERMKNAPASSVALERRRVLMLGCCGSGSHSLPGSRWRHYGSFAT